MERFALISHRVGCTLIVVSQLLCLPCTAEESIATNAIRSRMRELLKENEAKWRDVYKKELEQPVLNPIEGSQLLFPGTFSSLQIGITEDQVHKVRPNVSEAEAGPSLIRDVYEFVPGRLTEKLEQEDWKSVIYQIRRKRLAGVMFMTPAAKELAQVVKPGREVCSKFLTQWGKPTEIRAAKNLWGVPNRVMLIWKEGEIFAALLNAQGDDDQFFLALLVGAQPIFEDQMKLYDFASLPPEEVEALARERFPYLNELWQRTGRSTEKSTR